MQVCYQDALTAPGVHHRPLHHPLSRCPRILETRYLDLREVVKLKNCILMSYCHPWLKFSNEHYFWNNVSKYAISFFWPLFCSQVILTSTAEWFSQSSLQVFIWCTGLSSSPSLMLLWMILSIWNRSFIIKVCNSIL